MNLPDGMLSHSRGRRYSTLVLARRWDDECDRALVEGVVVGVDQGDRQRVRTAREGLQDDRGATRVGPDPWGAVEADMNMSDPW